MKFALKDAHKPPIPFPGSNLRPPMPKLMGYFILLFSATFLIYSLNLLSSHNYDDDDTNNHPFFPNNHNSLPERTRASRRNSRRQLRLEHIVFGIAGSAELWDQRKNYIKFWWNPQRMRGTVWFDSPVKTRPEENLPHVRVSENTTRFAYSNRQGHRSAIRISRIVSETVRSLSSSSEEIRWLVMGDDDTVFVTENLVRVLSKYDEREYYYVGGLSESHIQNIYYSYSMAYGGGGFAISYPLAKAVERMQDGCIQRYPALRASDDRMQACMAELGVPLTRELGFHQHSSTSLKSVLDGSDIKILLRGKNYFDIWTVPILFYTMRMNISMDNMLKCFPSVICP